MTRLRPKEEKELRGKIATTDEADALLIGVAQMERIFAEIDALREELSSTKKSLKEEKKSVEYYR